MYICLQNFPEKRCYNPGINQKISTICEEIYKFKPPIEYVLVKQRSLSKGGFTAEGGSTNGVFVEENYNSSYKSTYKQSKTSSSKTSSKFGQRHEAVQIWPQEVNLKLRISE